MSKQGTTPESAAASAAAKKATATQKAVAQKKLTKSAAEKLGLGKVARTTAAKRKTRGSKVGLTTPSYSELTEIVITKTLGVTLIEVYEEQVLEQTAEEEEINFDTADLDLCPAPLESRGTGPEAY